MNKLNCSTIKTLERKLICLKEKYEQLTKRLEEEQANSSSEESAINYRHIIEERGILEKYMQKIEKRLEKKEKEPKVGNTDTISQGATVCLESDGLKLTFRLVEEIYSHEENQISLGSPMGKAIKGKRVGDKVKVKTPNGHTTYKVKNVKHLGF